MLRSSDENEIKQLYESMLWKYEKLHNPISTKFPDVGLNCKKRFKTIIPELGFVHSYNEYVYPLKIFCDKYRNNIQENYASLTTQLSENIMSLKFSRSQENRTAYETHIKSHQELCQDKMFIEIQNFILEFKKWIDGEFENKNIYLEPFQKNLLLHVILFIAVTRTPLLANHISNFLIQIFGINFMEESHINNLKQRTVVFLVPRRHGKTWFIIYLISFLLKNIHGISIGYVAHQKHVSLSVMKDIEFKCRRMFPNIIITKQDNVVTLDHAHQKSTALFASCYNTHVSIFKYLLLFLEWDRIL
ncbi:putative terminase [Murid herpesvirus 3]|uniref:Terminase n=2 Tax=Murid betaherpesvirus 3 TaxID=2560603 RepID=A0A1P8VIX9_9BETA|nr:putative terminase [Murine roseolovirus]APZ76295.1 putative terminase [Murid betaherpesvirus 3]AYH64766.1 putative terminase [Murid herpesvirus 3]